MNIGNIVLFVIGFFIIGILSAILFAINNSNKIKSIMKEISFYFFGAMLFFIALSGCYLIGIFFEIGNPKGLYWMLVFLFTAAGAGHIFYLIKRLYRDEQPTVLNLLTLTVALFAFGISLFKIFGAIIVSVIGSEMNYTGVFDSSVFWFLLPIVWAITFRYFKNIPAPIHVGLIVHKTDPPSTDHSKGRITVSLKIKAGRRIETYKIKPPHYFRLHQVLHHFFIEKQKSGEIDPDSILHTLDDQKTGWETVWLFYKKDAWWKPRRYLPRNSLIRDFDQNPMIEKTYTQTTKVKPGMHIIINKQKMSEQNGGTLQAESESTQTSRNSLPVLYALKMRNPVLTETKSALAVQTE